MDDPDAGDIEHDRIVHEPGDLVQGVGHPRAANVQLCREVKLALGDRVVHLDGRNRGEGLPVGRLELVRGDSLDLVGGLSEKEREYLKK